MDLSVYVYLILRTKPKPFKKKKNNSKGSLNCIEARERHFKAAHLSHDSFMIEYELKQNYKLYRHLPSQCNGEHFHNMLYNMKPFFFAVSVSSGAVHGKRLRSH